MAQASEPTSSNCCCWGHSIAATHPTQQLALEGPLVTDSRNRGCSSGFLYAGFEKRTCDPWVPFIFVVTVLVPVAAVGAMLGKSELQLYAPALLPAAWKCIPFGCV